MVAGVIITHITQGGSDEPPVLITRGPYIMCPALTWTTWTPGGSGGSAGETGLAAGMLDWNLSVEIITDLGGDKYIQ